MPYADSDFFIALMKENDWLAGKAERLLKEHKGRIWTSQWTVAEILLLSEEYLLDPEIVVASIGQIASVKGGTDVFMAAAHMMKEGDMTTFDALHAVSSGGEEIISSDSVFDRVGLRRIQLER